MTNRVFEPTPSHSTPFPLRIDGNRFTNSMGISTAPADRYRANLNALPPLLLRVSETAELLSVSRSTAYRLIRTGELPSLKVGGVTRVPFDQLCYWVAENTRMGEAA